MFWAGADQKPLSGAVHTHAARGMSGSSVAAVEFNVPLAVAVVDDLHSDFSETDKAVSRSVAPMAVRWFGVCLRLVVEDDWMSEGCGDGFQRG